MPLTKPNGPATLQPRRPGSRRSVFSFRVFASLIAFFAAASFGAAVSFAQSQDVAEAARQEQARKQKDAQQKNKKHVYTNEDLAKAKILTPEDRAQVEAKRNECVQKKNCGPAQNSQDTLDANSEKPGTSLGEVARQYRKQKEQQKELDALKPKQSEPFHLPSSESEFAAPVLPERPLVRPVTPPVLRPKNNSHVMKRDPFAATIPMRPARPEISKTVSPKANTEIQDDDSAEIENDAGEIRSEAPRNLFDVRPSVRPRSRMTSPRKPNFSLRAPENFVMQPGQPVAPAQPKTFGTPKPVNPEHRKAAQPKAPSFGKLAAPAVTIRPAQPAQPVQPKVTAPMTSTPKASSVSPVAPSVAPVAPSLSPVRPSVSSPASPAVAASKTVSVQRGDSLWKLAEKNLGSGNRWPELVAANKWISDPNQIRAGALLALPAAVAKRSAADTGKSHAANAIQVQRGDTLWGLAKANLGRATDWPCLAAANPRIADPNHIYEGQELVVPSGCRDAGRGSLRPDEQ